MITLKKKRCKICNELTYIFSHGNCKSCDAKIKICKRISRVKYQTKQIKKVSDKQKKLNLAYLAQREIYLEQHPFCKVGLEGCMGKATTVHHKIGRNKFLLDETTWLPCCMFCHHYIETHGKWAKEKGYSLSRLEK
jgi:ElaB/YqjD/DUF883 family membrane-anchored ribosome-binding protein